MGYTQPLFNVRKIAGGYSIYPDGVTTDDLTISANPVDTYSSIKIFGGTGGITLGLVTGSYLQVHDGGVECLRINYATPDVIITSPIANKNLSLVTTGTGVVKFGTYTAGAATDSTGYITILDALGNTRKLMVQA